MTEASNRFHLPALEFRREPLTLFLLTGLAILLVGFVALFSRIYHAKIQSLAEDWSARGAADLNAHRYSDAVLDFRTALLYDRDNDSYQLLLAEALIGDNRPDEASTYLVNLWDKKPENGTVNLELARIAASKDEITSARRYYNNAIYATWPDDQGVARRNVRLELIQFLMRNHSTAHAQAQLIALAANIGDDPPVRAQVASLFFQTGDYQQALGQYQLSLRGDPHNAQTLAGAGQAAFELGRYLLARRYLREAVSLKPADKDSAGRLRLAELVIQMDPFRSQMRAADRERIVMQDFAAAGDRLKACAAAASASPTQATPAVVAGATKTFQQRWNQLKPLVNAASLRRNPDLVNAAMSLAFQIERAGNESCGPGLDTDKALLLIADLHEGL